MSTSKRGPVHSAERMSGKNEVTFSHTAITTSTKIPFENRAGGQIIIPSGWAGGTTLTWYVSHDGTTWVAAYDKNGAAITQTIAANRGYPIPVDLFGAPWIAATVDTSTGAGYVFTKS